MSDPEPRKTGVTIVMFKQVMVTQAPVPADQQLLGAVVLWGQQFRERTNENTKT